MKFLMTIGFCGGAAVGLPGCAEAKPRAVSYPPGTLPVQYEGATSNSTCLTACVAMAANYLLGEHKFSENVISDDLRKMGLDATRVGDLQRYVIQKDLYLWAYKGRIDDKPPLGLKYLLTERGYPVICIIAPAGAGPAYNHAVVVIGISANRGGGAADSIHYFDPASEKQLHSVDTATFDKMWSLGQHVLLFVARQPQDLHKPREE